MELFQFALVLLLLITRIVIIIVCNIIFILYTFIFNNEIQLYYNFNKDHIYRNI